MVRIGLLSFSDGRERVHESLIPTVRENERCLTTALTETSGFTVVKGDSVINGPESARQESQRMLAAGIDAVVFNIPVFAFPNLAVMAAKLIGKPVICIAPENGTLPGLGGILACGGGLHQLGIPHETVWGNIEDSSVRDRVTSFLRAASVVNRLRGQVYGLFGGRSIGIGTGSAEPDRWMRLFGVDVEHVGEVEIIRRATEMHDERVLPGLEWLEARCSGIFYDGESLTTDTLAFQLKCYLATKELARERGLDFVGVKCHYDLSENYVTQCMSCALFNDPYDWTGPKEPIPFACEADSDGALTMQILQLLTGQPTLLTDIRHFDRETGLYVFCNCGAQATWLANRSGNADENLAKVSLYPTISKYRAGGAHLQFVAAPGQVTFARLFRTPERYEMAIFRGELVSMPLEALKRTCWEWPHAFARIPIEPENLFGSYHANHTHFVYGDWQNELVKICDLLGIKPLLLCDVGCCDVGA